MEEKIKKLTTAGKIMFAIIILTILFVIYLSIKLFVAGQTFRAV